MKVSTKQLEEFENVCKKIRNCGYELSKIKIVEKEIFETKWAREFDEICGKFRKYYKARKINVNE